MARYVEPDASIALCCLFLLTDWDVYIRSNTTDAKINKHSLTNCKIQIPWQSAKSNQEETAPLVSVCRLQQTLLMRFFFSSTEYVPIHFFLLFPPKHCAHASIAKALSGLGLILIPKCFTASVITSS